MCRPPASDVFRERGHCTTDDDSGPPEVRTGGGPRVHPYLVSTPVKWRSRCFRRLHDQVLGCVFPSRPPPFHGRHTEDPCTTEFFPQEDCLRSSLLPPLEVFYTRPRTGGPACGKGNPDPSLCLPFRGGQGYRRWRDEFTVLALPHRRRSEGSSIGLFAGVNGRRSGSVCIPTPRGLFSDSGFLGVLPLTTKTDPVPAPDTRSASGLRGSPEKESLTRLIRSSLVPSGGRTGESRDPPGSRRRVGLRRGPRRGDEWALSTTAVPDAIVPRGKGPVCKIDLFTWKTPNPERS